LIHIHSVSYSAKLVNNRRGNLIVLIRSWSQVKPATLLILIDLLLLLCGGVVPKIAPKGTLNYVGSGFSRAWVDFSTIFLFTCAVVLIVYRRTHTSIP